MPNHIRKRLRLHQSWTNDIPLKNIWGIQFSARSGSGAMSIVGNSVKNVLDEYRPQSLKVDTGLFDRVSDSSIGFMLAQNVSFPDETFGVQNTQVSNSGGFQPIQIGGSRSSSNKLSVQFLETNRDVFSFFIQPWIVALSYAGLIETDEQDLKCHIDVIQYSRSASRYADKLGDSNSSGTREVEYGIRKMHTFYNCVPTTSEGDKIEYAEMKTIKDRGAAFNFSHYQLNTPRGVLD
ncbi:hypothetical protein N9273_00315 [bacterium]|nr:hypothetical protein [bacterium]